MKSITSKVFITTILIMVLSTNFTGCGVSDSEGTEISSGSGNLEMAEKAAVENEKFNYSINLSENITENCNVNKSDDGSEIYFNLKDGGDMVMCLITEPNESYEEQLGRQVIKIIEDYTVYIQFPTCGTLNNEKLRELWNALIEEGKGIDEKDITVV